MIARIDYGQAGWPFIARIMNENSDRLSRTRKGVSDTSTSDVKRPLLLAGEALKRRSAENEERAQRYVFDVRSDPPPADGRDVLGILWGVADRTNDGLLPSGKLREWAIKRTPNGGANGVVDAVPVSGLEMALGRFADQIAARWSELACDPVPLAAWAEWELNGGSLHPFYDGCGRISRSFAALLLVRSGCLLPLYDDIGSYFFHGNQGEEAFVQYVRNRITACRQWQASVT